MNTVTKTQYELKAGTPTVWVQVGESNVEALTAGYHSRVVGAAPFMRRLGGSETLTKSYTCNGYVVTRIVSKSPCKTRKSVYEFNLTERLA